MQERRSSQHTVIHRNNNNNSNNNKVMKYPVDRLRYCDAAKSTHRTDQIDEENNENAGTHTCTSKLLRRRWYSRRGKSSRWRQAESCSPTYCWSRRTTRRWHQRYDRPTPSARRQSYSRARSTGLILYIRSDRRSFPPAGMLNKIFGPDLQDILRFIIRLS